MGFVSDLVGGIGDAVGDVAGGIGDILGGAVNGVGDALGGVGDFIGGNPWVLAAALPFVGPLAGAFGPGVIGSGLGSAAGSAALGAGGMAATGSMAPWLSGSSLDGALGSGMYGIGDSAIGSAMGLGLGDGALGVLSSGFAGVPLSDLGLAGSIGSGLGGGLGLDQGMNEWNKLLGQDAATPGSFWDQNMSVPSFDTTGGSVMDFVRKYGSKIGNQALRSMQQPQGQGGNNIPQVSLPNQQPLGLGLRSGYGGLTPMDISSPFGNTDLISMYGAGAAPYYS